MRIEVDRLLTLTFYAVFAYLVLMHWKGANTFLKTTFGGYASSVKALQGR